jgi:competence protein ComEC
VTPLARSLWKAVPFMWLGALVGFGWGWRAALAVVAVAGAMLAVGGRRWAMVGLVLALGVCSGLVAQAFERGQLEALASDSRRLTFHARALSDPLPGRFGWRQVVRPVAVVSAPGAVTPWQGPALVVHTPGPVDAVVGDTVQITGRIQARSGFVERFPVAGVVADPDVVPVEADIGAVRGLANLIRGRVLGDLDLGDRGEALLAGFLVGDTSGVSDADLDSLRRAGLTHYVAVSGSNVALFLALWWLVLAPVARYPRLRALSGLAGVVVFALVTRAEPSVVRAGAMVSVLLVGRLFGWAFDRWTALAIGVLGCLAVSGRLAVDVGFALSVAATMGVMWGANRFTFEPKPVATVVGASLSAQVAVAPILLAVFGSMPLLSPLANLVAAPLVAASTATGGVGALAGVGPLVWLGSSLADLVLFVAELAAPWPQAGPAVVLGVAVLALVGWRFTGLRPALAMLSAGAVALAVFPFGVRLDVPAVVFLDIGQGDSELIVGDGFTVLIDGGPDPVLLGRKLDEYGIGRIDLLIVSHVHADHIEGLRSVVGVMPVGEVWTAFEGQSTPAASWISEAAPAAGLSVVEPPVGTVVERGGIRLEVLAPLRRYASPNDQSIVVDADIGGRRFLFPGDIEVIAQHELQGLTTDVLKVPHQGAATSDPDWLAAVSADIAVISVGPNNFGHPADWVIETLQASGAVVKRTDLDGDVIVGPNGLTEPHPWWQPWR